MQARETNQAQAQPDILGGGEQRNETDIMSGRGRTGGTPARADTAVTEPAIAQHAVAAPAVGIAADVGAVITLLAGLWLAISPRFLTLQKGATNANINDLIIGLAAAMIVGVALSVVRRPAALVMAVVPVGIWAIVSPFILAVHHTVTAGMYWSNIITGAIIVLAGLAAVMRRPVR